MRCAVYFLMQKCLNLGEPTRILIHPLRYFSAVLCQTEIREIESGFSSIHLFEFLDLGLLKHGEHIGVGSLCCPLLGFLGGLF